MAPVVQPTSRNFLLRLPLATGDISPRDLSARVTAALASRSSSGSRTWSDGACTKFPGYAVTHVKMNVNTHRAVQSVWFTMAFLWAVEWRRCCLADSPNRSAAGTAAWGIEIDGKKSNSIFRPYLFSRRDAAASTKRTFLLVFTLD